MPTERLHSFTPSDFMRDRRPDLVSDSEVLHEYTLPDDELNFRLDTLTQHKQEQDFEHLARRLMEKVVCPNLTFQTGPTGGGDRKVDAETYPVAEQIAERWYVGTDEASKERWAFAISAKKDWRPKLKADVKKAVETNRNYTKVYFITNQAVRDKTSGEIDDSLAQELSELHKVRVIIFDRLWIADTIRQKGLWDLLFDCLHIERPQPRKTVQLGPLDAERQRELTELDELIEDSDRYQYSKYQLAQDCLHAALLARGLGRDRKELDGRFSQSERIARKSGSPEQLARVLFEHAWTSNFWFDDFSDIEKFYGEIEKLAFASESIWMLDKLGELHSAAAYWRLSEPGIYDNTKWDERLSRLRAELQKFVDRDGRSTSALYARTQLALFSLLTPDTGTEKQLLDFLNEMKEVLDEAKNHVDFPVMRVSNVLLEFGQFIEDDKIFDEILESVNNLRSDRTGDSSKGKFWLERAFQTLDAEEPYKAIEQFSKAQRLLSHEEDCYNFGLSFVGMSMAFDSIGMLWAARSNLLAACHRRLASYAKTGHIDVGDLNILCELAWIELRLGRVLPALAFLNSMGSVLQRIDLEPKGMQEAAERIQSIDRSIGILILKSSLSDLEQLTRFGTLLKESNLTASYQCLLFALGQTEKFQLETGDKETDLDDFFTQVLKASSSEFPDRVEWHVTEKIKMTTKILGCEIQMVTQNEDLSILTAEAVLAFLECFLSTTLTDEKMCSCRAHLLIELKCSKQETQKLKSRIEEDEFGEQKIVIKSSLKKPSDLMDKHSRGILTVLQHATELIIGPIAGNFDSERFLAEAFSRIRWAAATPITLSSVLGKPKYRVADWVDQTGAQELKALRTTKWQPKYSEAPDPEQSDGDKETLPGRAFLKHREIVIHSPINWRVWERAIWDSTGIVVDTERKSNFSPGLILVFKDYVSGKKIFKGWRKRFGEADDDELLDVTIILGINKVYPAAYRIVITSRLIETGGDDKSIQFARTLDMEPIDGTRKNLDTFIEEFKDLGHFYLMPGARKSGSLNFDEDLSIKKCALKIINAWEIGSKDGARIGVQPTDNPIIPTEQKDAPVLELLRNLAANESG